MSDAITAQEMRDIERAAIESGAVTGLELMERAGLGVVEAVMEEWPELATGTHRAIVLCGPGNNGGDGFVVARLLADLGWKLDVYMFGGVQVLPKDARTNHDRWIQKGRVKSSDFLQNDGFLYYLVDASYPEPQERAKMGLMDGPPDLFVDALFGTGLSRPIELTSPGRPNVDPTEDPDEEYQTPISHWFSLPDFHMQDDEPLRSVAIDIPSGICSDTGNILGIAFHVQLCVTFHRAKMGHHLGDGQHHYRKLVVKDIGL